jgi:aspartyl protease family protein
MVANMNDMPRAWKVVTVWLMLATLVFLAVQFWLAERQRASFQVDGMGVVELRRAPDGHFHWPARVNGRQVEFLVDTGATRSALPGALAQQLGLERMREVQSSTAGGVVAGYETRVDLALDGGLQARQWRVTVLPDLAAPLLGMDVLSRLHFSQQDGVLRLAPLR